MLRSCVLLFIIYRERWQLGNMNGVMLGWAGLGWAGLGWAGWAGLAAALLT